jgi:hypothetical protein
LRDEIEQSQLLGLNCFARLRDVEAWTPPGLTSRNGRPAA